jgi:hypothetical protein
MPAKTFVIANAIIPQCTLGKSLYSRREERKSLCFCGKQFTNLFRQAASDQPFKRILDE